MMIFHGILLFSQEFYFNAVGSILGTLVLDEQRSHNGLTCILPYDSFLATPLLPCSKVDRPIQKFTGNDSFGKSSNNLTMAIHAFTHFTLVYTRKSVIITDLQGTRDVSTKTVQI
jgi:hypothetical protein